MSTQVKICGITSVEDALDAVELGADFLGFDFYPDSSRFLDPEECAVLLQNIPDNVAKVGLFLNANPQDVIDISTQLQLSVLQFCGDETPEYCQQFARPYMKVLSPQNVAEAQKFKDFGGDYVFIDDFVQNSTNGGMVLADWETAREAQKYGPLFLSGGLTIDNIDTVIRTVKPFGVSVSRGVESQPGRKDYRKVEEFIMRVKSI